MFQTTIHAVSAAELRASMAGASGEPRALLLRIARGEHSLREADGFTDEEMERRYREASALFTDGNFAGAREGFVWLTAQEPREAAYWVALGCAQQALGEHEAAGRSFAAAAMLDIENPAPHFYAAECLAAQGHLAAARLAAMGALEVASGKREHAAIAAGAVMFLGRLSGEVR